MDHQRAGIGVSVRHADPLEPMHVDQNNQQQKNASFSTIQEKEGGCTSAYFKVVAAYQHVARPSFARNDSYALDTPPPPPHPQQQQGPPAAHGETTNCCSIQHCCFSTPLPSQGGQAKGPDPFETSGGKMGDEN